MERTISFMERNGTVSFLEFREGGVEGVKALREAAAGYDIDPVILGRETPDVLEIADGYGASGANDDDFTQERAAAKDAAQLFGIHAGEVDSSDINLALDLDPDFLVHMVHAEELHLERVDDSDTPVVVCPRSNVTTEVGLPPVTDLLDRTTVALGTDNVMLNSPSMFREMEFTEKLTGASTTEVLRMATINGAEIADLNCGLIEEGREAYVLVIDGDSDNLAGAKDPGRAVVRRAGVDDIADVIRPADTA
jgi:cytosine/adenosine deaminase-related metal-dependent hydrolase